MAKRKKHEDTTVSLHPLTFEEAVKDLVAGSGIGFEDRGHHALKGVPDEWRLFAVERDSAAAQAR